MIHAMDILMAEIVVPSENSDGSEEELKTE